MTDISKCDGDSCPLKEHCKRYTAPSGFHQSWILPGFKDGECEYFWDEKHTVWA